MNEKQNTYIHIKNTHKNKPYKEKNKTYFFTVIKFIEFTCLSVTMMLIKTSTIQMQRWSYTYTHTLFFVCFVKITELMEKGNLRQVLERDQEALTLAHRLRMAVQIAKALYFRKH